MIAAGKADNAPLLARPCRVLYLSASPQIGGAEESLLTLLSALDRSSFQPFLAVPGGSESPLGSCAAALGVECFAVPIPNPMRTLNPLRLWRVWREIQACGKAVATIAVDHGIDLIHANTASAALAADGAPIICHLRDLRLPFVAAAVLRAKCRIFIAVSQAVSAFASRRLSRPVRCLPNGVDLNRFRPGAGNAGQKQQYLLMAAHLAPWKRHDIFIECLAAVRSRDASIKGIIAGCDLFGRHSHYVQGMRRLADDLGLHYALEWLGAVERDKMPTLFSCATAVIHPAIEPFGRSILEAMACATPVVAADGGGGRELLTNGGGVLIKPGDVAGFATAAWRYATDPTLARNHGADGHRVACQLYSADGHARRVEEIYRELVGKMGARKALEKK